ncbi:hypothetical protein ABENE_20705 [Asticcacaulis benevestitus DSM 16100 = ATCC BAA-896]|uniref:Uncharacterized protein n=1 Tax=Asticcacaulis benevestitus DSM 16100 = ATCC BAA-896 TaxID=1121022 RepID=V4QUG7_9CAUL|nr:hypothetical protein ABENE_20705 [Asticcacaulis benevestitus DSM 16100 = ATCC BAA-896]
MDQVLVQRDGEVKITFGTQDFRRRISLKRTENDMMAKLELTTP